jgi:hypothetical protein
MADAHTHQPTPTSYRFHLTGAGRSDVTITVVASPGGGGAERPTRVTGTIQKPLLTPPRDKTLIPHSMNGDEDAWELLKEASFEGGHLVGLAFGGPDNEMNIAPMNKGANSGTGTWGAIERAMATQYAALAMGETLQIDVGLHYGGATDPRVPVRVSGSVWKQNAGGWPTATTQIDLQVQPPADRTNCLTPPLETLCRDIYQAAAATGFATLVSTVDKPNAPLDVVDYKYNANSIALRVRIRAIHPLLADYPLHGIRKKGGYGVRPQQRLLALFFNRYRNKRGPQKTALLTAEDVDNLGLILREWEAQHDHTTPKAHGGSNHYSNLVLTHHRVNNRRGAVGNRYKKRRNRSAPVRFSPY